MRKASVGCAGSVNALRRLDDQVGLAEQPPVRERPACGGSSLRVAFGAPVFAHASISAICCIGERMLADEMADAGLHLPRRHEAAARDLRDLRGAAPHLVVGGKAERRRAHPRDGTTCTTLKTIGAMSRVNVTSCANSARDVRRAGALAPANIAGTVVANKATAKAVALRTSRVI